MECEVLVNNKALYVDTDQPILHVERTLCPPSTSSMGGLTRLFGSALTLVEMLEDNIGLDSFRQTDPSTK